MDLAEQHYTCRGSNLLVWNAMIRRSGAWQCCACSGRLLRHTIYSGFRQASNWKYGSQWRLWPRRHCEEAYSNGPCWTALYMPTKQSACVKHIVIENRAWSVYNEQWGIHIKKLFIEGLLIYLCMDLMKSSQRNGFCNCLFFVSCLWIKIFRHESNDTFVLFFHGFCSCTVISSKER
jgi:hypothetical protein